MGKLLPFHFRVTNSKLKNIKLHFELIARKIKKKDYDLEFQSLTLDRM